MCGAQDIETLIELNEGIRPGCTACCAVPVDASGVPLVPGRSPTSAATPANSDEEGLVCVAEVRNEKVRCQCSPRTCTCPVVDGAVRLCS